MKTYEADLKKDWERAEYLRCKQQLAELEKKPYSPFIFCYKCKKQVVSLMLHVVNFGKDVSCDSCYHKHWSKKRNRIAQFAVPEALQDQFEQDPPSQELQDQINSDKEKTLQLAKDHCDELKEKMANATFKP